MHFPPTASWSSSSPFNSSWLAWKWLLADWRTAVSSWRVVWPHQALLLSTCIYWMAVAGKFNLDISMPYHHHQQQQQQPDPTKNKYFGATLPLLLCILFCGCCCPFKIFSSWRDGDSLTLYTIRMGGRLMSTSSNGTYEEGRQHWLRRDYIGVPHLHNHNLGLNS